jgi:2,5-dihydroxypyridine 5,6-dioxygenase
VSEIPYHWIERFGEQFEHCGLQPSETAVLLSESRSRTELVETARLALERSGAATAHVILPTPANRGPVPIRSTGASQAIAGNRSAIAAMAAADFVVDCTVEGLLHAPELGQILGAGTRVLMISNEHPENFERLPHDPALADRVAAGTAMLERAHTMRVTSPAGTDLVIDLTGAVRAGSAGFTTDPGDIAHWPGGLVLAFPAPGTVNGTLVLAPGDINLTFTDYVRSPIRLAITDDYITDITPVDPAAPFDAELFASYLGSFDERDAYATSHVGWGMNPAARWDTIPLFDRSQINGTEARAFAGNFLYSTGANEVAGRFCRGHFDLPMRSCTITLDTATGSVTVVDAGVLQPPLAPPGRPGQPTPGGWTT